MTKFIIVLHLCSMITGQCPSSHFSVKNGFETHYDCALNGYAIAQKTYMELKKLETYFCTLDAIFVFNSFLTY